MIFFSRTGFSDESRRSVPFLFVDFISIRFSKKRHDHQTIKQMFICKIHMNLGCGDVYQFGKIHLIHCFPTEHSTVHTMIIMVTRLIHRISIKIISRSHQSHGSQLSKYSKVFLVGDFFHSAQYFYGIVFS